MGAIDTSPADGASASAVEPRNLPPEIARVLKIRVPVAVCLAEKKLRLSDILRFSVGSILEFDRLYSQPLDLRVKDQPIGCGEAVKVNEKFGLKITRLYDPRPFLRRLSPAASYR